MDASMLRTQLHLVARNHSWTWSPAAEEVFHALPGARRGSHPVALVDALDDSQLTELANDGELTAAVGAEVARVSAIEMVNDPEIAYFSPEFGITEVLPQYSGGLGILAGDHLKAASDLGLSLCGVGLFYRHGFFHQSLEHGHQTEFYATCHADELGAVDTGVVVEVPVGERIVAAKAWRFEVGSIPLVVLDTDLEANHPDDRAITDRLYGGDKRHRLRQELILGVGGARAISELGYRPRVHHLNEGHAAFLLLELLDRRIAEGATLTEAVAAVGPGLVFTTHTPVPAGIDRFGNDLATDHLKPWAEKWRLPVSDVVALGAEGPSVDESTFNMANFALRIAGRTNGVSKLHGQVSRALFADVERGDAIGSITNGVHARTWVHPPLQRAFDRRLGPGWANGEVDAWNRVDAVSDDDVRAVRADGHAVLAHLVHERTGVELTPGALTIGFARRFATYKRANLLLLEADRVAALLADDDRPVQFVFAGKAHPADGPGKALLAQIAAFAESSQANARFVLVPDYEISVAKAMYAGCDVWLNNPVRPREASGTSGEKSALNGGLNLSISDGWWAEMADDRNGFTIPTSDATDAAVRDATEARSILDLLETVVVPLYYAGDAAPSAEWIERVRHCWRTLGPRVTAARMVADYRDELYTPAAAASLV